MLFPMQNRNENGGYHMELKPIPDHIVRGADLGWVSHLEKEGYTFRSPEGADGDVLEILKNCGVEAVRLRVFVKPAPDGYWRKNENELCRLGLCAPADVLAMSRRVKDAGMKLYIDFHYSDRFADPRVQDPPEDWKDCSVPELEEHVRQHTTEVLGMLKKEGIVPDWVEVGNEINSGIMLPYGSFREHPDNLVRFLNAGFEAVKENDASTLVITHLAGLILSKQNCNFLDTFFALGGKTDILGFSHYPYWFQYGIEGDIPAAYLAQYAERYHKPVMIAEVGAEETDPGKTYQLLLNSIRALRLVPDGLGTGVFYWEPAACAAVLPDHYALSAATLEDGKVIRLTKAMNAYKDSRKIPFDLPDFSGLTQI